MGAQLWLPPRHADLADVSADQHQPRAHDHSLAADGITLAIAGGLNLPSVITPGQVIADIHNYDPNGKDIAFFWRLSFSAAWNWSGLVYNAGFPGPHWVTNIGTFGGTLLHNSASSSANNRWFLPNNSNLTLGGSDSILVYYDADPAIMKWRVLGI
jgi:hypothetical protein